MTDIISIILDALCTVLHVFIQTTHLEILLLPNVLTTVCLH